MNIQIVDRVKLPILMRFICVIFIFNLLLAFYSLFEGRLLFGNLMFDGIFSKILSILLCTLWTAVLVGINDRRLYAVELVVSWMIFQLILNFSILIGMKHSLKDVILDLIANMDVLFSFDYGTELTYGLTFIKHLFILIFNIGVIVYFEKNKKLFK
ncbi:hypothetical protein HNP89_001944 [Methanococcus maripaludis]|uniref:Uncharacterized protein n=1 Tax=Methanococcus maripaludis TaxID=39152 RepID=A0A7J9P774_METMI|nr:hypothetical protein [Methanococcus maripaludis]MBA2853966.1 hypothetical protein [Methanococcus maripaludis]